MPLSRGFTTLIDKGFINAISLPRRCSRISHVLYVDDVILFCRGDAKSLKNLKSFLDLYGAVAGQLTNSEKSRFYIASTSSHRASIIRNILVFN